MFKVCENLLIPLYTTLDGEESLKKKLVILELPMLFLNIQPKPTFQVFRKNDILLTYCGSQSTLCRRLSEPLEDYKSLELKS